MAHRGCAKIRHVMSMETPSVERIDRKEPDIETDDGVLKAIEEGEDFRWTPSTKGFPRYWIPRLATDPPADLPERLVDVLCRYKSQTGTGKFRTSAKENAVLAIYINRRLRQLVDAKKEVELPANAVEAASREVVAELAAATNVQKATLGHEPLPESRERDDEDYRHPTTKQKWIRYWVPRLKADVEVLPDDVRAVVESGQIHLAPADERVLSLYVGGRIRALTFKLGKRQEMDKLKAELRRIDEREEMEPLEVLSRRTLSYDVADDILYVEEGEGERRRVTEGDVVADLIWGVTYRPDASVPPTTWRRLRKLSAIKETRARISDIWNRELAERESLSLPTTSLSPKFLEEHPMSGVVAERLAQSLLTRIQYDHPEAGLQVEPSNAFEDAELKYDFKVVFSKKTRGIAVFDESGTRELYVEEKRRLGIQFTIGKKLVHKETQIKEAKDKLQDERLRAAVNKPVEDIVLVAVPMKDISKIFKQWLGDGKPAGGPERYLSREAKLQLIESITSNISGFEQSSVSQML